MSRDLMCSASSSSCFMHQCLRMLVVNWSSGWQGRLSTIFTISSLGLWVRGCWVPCTQSWPQELLDLSHLFPKLQPPAWLYPSPTVASYSHTPPRLLSEPKNAWFHSLWQLGNEK
jgi:hypothetical protein